MAEYWCHTACFHARLEPSLRRATGPEIQRTQDGTITNAADLTADQVVGQRVLCPGCKTMVFARWPAGWDAHAAQLCTGVAADEPERRKAEFKRRFGALFRSTAADTE